MLEFACRGVRCRVSPLFPALLTVLLICQPEGTALLCVVASLLHEAGHLLAMLLWRCPPSRCTVSAFGARIETAAAHPPGYGANIAISLAGPVVNGAAAGILSAVGCCRGALVHAVLGAVNLLPAAALDGGQILRCLLCLVGKEERADRVLRAVSAAVLFPLAAAAFYLFLSGGNATLLIVSAYLAGLIFFAPD